MSILGFKLTYLKANSAKKSAAKIMMVFDTETNSIRNDDVRFFIRAALSMAASLYLVGCCTWEIGDDEEVELSWLLDEGEFKEVDILAKASPENLKLYVL